MSVSSKIAAQIDKELMGPTIGFTLQQLMELAGFSVAQTVQRVYPLAHNSANRVVGIIAGPGNNGGDGLVCARHLKLFGYEPIVLYPSQRGKVDFYDQLLNQLKFFNVPVFDHSETFWAHLKDTSKVVCLVDSIFGFSFRPPIRGSYKSIITKMVQLQNDHSVDIVCVDIPSGWDVDKGPVLEPTEDNPNPQETYIKPKVLVSLTMPKPCSQYLSHGAKHFVGGRFITQEFASRFGMNCFEYPETDQILQLS